MAIYIFYHVFCNGATGEVVRDQIKNIHFSGIYRVVDAVYYCLAGDTQEKIDEIAAIFERSGTKFRQLRAAVGDTSYERLTLGAIREIVGPEDVFCYIHTKGIKEYHNKDRNAMNSWRQKMEYFLFSRAPDYLELLRDGKYDTAGCIYRRNPKPHYSGNFWWCRGDYYLRLPADIAADDYFAPEMYILSGGARALCLNDNDENKDDYFHHCGILNFYVDTETRIEYIREM